MSDHTEKNRSIAKAIGWTSSSPYGVEIWHDNNGLGRAGLRDFYTNLNQATDHIIPVLTEIGHIVKLKAYPKHQAFPFLITTDRINYSFEGEGSNTHERMASGLCQLLLRIAENHPELLKEALERLAA